MNTPVLRRRALLLAAGALAAAASAKALRPTKHLADELAPIQLERQIPRAFGPWSIDTATASAIVNPQQVAQLEKLYSEILTRTYVHRDTGYRIMLSIVYGDDQRDSLSLHYPDVCYPAQGFQVDQKSDDLLRTPFGPIQARRMSTRMGARHEPVTYWVLIGDTAVVGGAKRKLAQLRYSLTGRIPDGLLFRVSSIDVDARRAFAAHGQFVVDLLHSVPEARRPRLFGLNASARSA